MILIFLRNNRKNVGGGGNNRSIQNVIAYK
jgi:hypothetical protein